MRENADQNDSEYGHFSLSVNLHSSILEKQAAWDSEMNTEYCFIEKLCKCWLLVKLLTYFLRE